MKRFIMMALISILSTGDAFCSEHFIPASHPYIQYYGRWDFSDSLAPAHSWPGVYISVAFEGTRIAVKLKDNGSYYNVFIDGKLIKIFKGDSSTVATYNLASGLSDGMHTLYFTKRSETTWTKFSFHGLILDEGKNILPPEPKPVRKIEFVGDSFTSAQGNEYDKEDKPMNDAPLTNAYEGFGAIVARHFNAQFHLTSRAGFGLIHDWQGITKGNLPDYFDRTLVCSETPKWDFTQWIPNLVVIGLGLNDYSGFGGWQGKADEADALLFKSRYHEFIIKIRQVYPGVKILAVAPHVEWLQKVISEMVQEENTQGNSDVFYTFYPCFEGGYVYGGHPNVATHYAIADRLIAAIDKMGIW